MESKLRASTSLDLSAQQLWVSVGAATRMNYTRSLKRWLVYCDGKGCRLGTNDARIIQEFITELSSTLGASGIKSCMSGFKWVFKLFNYDWQLPMSVQPQIRGIANTQEVPQDAGAITPHDWLRGGHRGGAGQLAASQIRDFTLLTIM